MKSRILICITAMTLFAALAVPIRLTAQEQQQQKEEHQRYKLIDIGTFGGPASYLDVYQFTGYSQQDLNDQGMVAGSADTSTPDPYAPNCFNPDCFVSHTFRWENGVLTDLGAVPGGSSSLAAWISGTGLIAGESQNGVIDPMSGLPEFDAVLWKAGQIINLGTLGGTLSSAFAVNNRGQVVGAALNGIPDPFYPSQARPFLWQNGVMQDLGTLGGPDAFAVFVNERGQIAGWSFTNSTPNPVTGIPTEHPFLWENGKMQDLGTLGGTVGFPNGLNNRAQVIGVSNLAGDLTFHPFLWTKSQGMRDLGTFGGSNGQVTWVNDAGEIVGSADFPDQIHHAFLWKRGVITDLGTVGTDPCSREGSINSKGQVVGGSSDCSTFLHAYLWEKEGPMIDLNTLVPPGSGLQLTVAVHINDRGEIAGLGVPPGCSPQNVETCGHAFLLIPCGEGDDGCQGENPIGVTQSGPDRATQRPSTSTPANPALSDRPNGMLDRLRGRRFPGLRTLGPGTGPAN